MAARAAATARPCSAPLAMTCCAASRILAQRRAIAPADSIADSMIARSPVGVSFALPHGGARSPVQAPLRAVHLLPPAPKGSTAPAPHPRRPEGWPTRRWPALRERRTPQCSARRRDSPAPAPRGARPVTRRARASRQPALARGAVVDGARASSAPDAPWGEAAPAKSGAAAARPSASASAAGIGAAIPSPALGPRRGAADLAPSCQDRGQNRGAHRRTGQSHARPALSCPNQSFCGCMRAQGFPQVEHADVRASDRASDRAPNQALARVRGALAPLRDPAP